MYFVLNNFVSFFFFFCCRITYYLRGLPAAVHPNFATHSRNIRTPSSRTVRFDGGGNFSRTDHHGPTFRFFENDGDDGWNFTVWTVFRELPRSSWISRRRGARPDPIFSPVTIRQFDLRPCCNLAREEFLSWHWIFLFLFPFSFRITRIRYYFHPEISLNYFNWCLSCTITKIKQSLANKNLQTFYDIHFFFVEINLKLGRSNFYNSIIIFLYCVITSCQSLLFWTQKIPFILMSRDESISTFLPIFLFIFNLDIKVYSKSR